MIRDVFMTGRIGDYVVDFMRPNVHFVLESGKEFTAPIYSEKMYEDCKAFRVDKATMKRIDALYAEFLESLKNMNPDDSLTKYLMEKIKRNKKYAKLLGL